MVVHLGFTYSGSYNAVNNAPISSASTFTLADHFGSLARWNGEIPNSGWWLNPENGGNALSQTAGTGIPGASGTFSSDGATVTLKFAATNQTFDRGGGLRTAPPNEVLYRY